METKGTIDWNGLTVDYEAINEGYDGAGAGPYLDVEFVTYADKNECEDLWKFLTKAALEDIEEAIRGQL